MKVQSKMVQRVLISMKLCLMIVATIKNTIRAFPKARRPGASVLESHCFSLFNDLICTSAS